MAFTETAAVRRPVTLSNELSRLADAVGASGRLANRAESLSGSLTGHFPVPQTSDESSSEGYFFALRNLIDALISNQDRMNFALSRIGESLDDNERPDTGQLVGSVTSKAWADPTRSF